MPSIDEVVVALRAAGPAGDLPPGLTPEAAAALAGRPPVGVMRRLWVIGGLQVRVGLPYLGYWARWLFRDADRRERERAKAHLRAAAAVVAGMGYLRGAAMKAGQGLANLPGLLPSEFVDTLDRLHFEAPPMHPALVREQLRGEFGCDPGDAFAVFDLRPFAVASLGQVHRAVLPSGREVAVKVQYPAIAKSILADFRLLGLLLSPLRPARERAGLATYLADICRTIERETDYRAEAAALRSARALFRESDGVIVPRVYDELSTGRVLTMERVPGVHLSDFLAGDPSQRLRDHFGTGLCRSYARLHYTGRMLYADPHPGNVLFAPDGRLGLVDFGCVRTYSAEEWEWARRWERATRQTPADRAAVFHGFVGLGPTEGFDPVDPGVLGEWAEWMNRPCAAGGPFDFGDGAYLRDGIALIKRLLRSRWARGFPLGVFSARWHMGLTTLLHRLRARVDVRAVTDSEYAVAAWD
ncbi:ABC1 kinase family protein [Fimbriiglobus ruber]|uniref:Ubiquinone biosynthesis monooxygenase UbiB n=1 Tax=Fimbriiglobus ruber TaxID=1908690 RepID=A0A225D5I8_9BACT|nr:AarF/ABC1/UbiB kinase family protein [Fimbriiglobus ruber]OWK36742.1 Ubiquinone biosynthesis monooxygenase UbiB [Fimbriiglobus ruber]